MGVPPWPWKPPYLVYCGQFNLFSKGFHPPPLFFQVSAELRGVLQAVHHWRSYAGSQAKSRHYRAPVWGGDTWAHQMRRHPKKIMACLSFCFVSLCVTFKGLDILGNLFFWSGMWGKSMIYQIHSMFLREILSLVLEETHQQIHQHRFVDKGSGWLLIPESLSRSTVSKQLLRRAPSSTISPFCWYESFLKWWYCTPKHPSLDHFSIEPLWIWGIPIFRNPYLYGVFEPPPFCWCAFPAKHDPFVNAEFHVGLLSQPSATDKLKVLRKSCQVFAGSSRSPIAAGTVPGGVETGDGGRNWKSLDTTRRDQNQAVSWDVIFIYNIRIYTDLHINTQWIIWAEMVFFKGGCAKHATFVGNMMIRHEIFGPNM